MLNSKRAQTGETITWLVATLIVVGLLVTFFYAALMLSKTKTISVTSFSGKVSSDWTKQKIAFANSITTNKNKEIILEWIDEGGEKK